MPPPSREIDLTSAWRALDGHSSGAGWKVIEIFSSGNCCVKAGRRGVTNEEGLLIGVRGSILATKAQLPRGQGFSLVTTELLGSAPDLNWFALMRHEHGAPELFTKVAVDLVALLECVSTEEGSRVYGAMVSRMVAWQSFMRRERDGALSTEEEIGLIGELIVLSNLIQDGVPPLAAVESWVGPSAGLHDFEIGSGAIEAKTTLSSSRHLARISNLDQMDDTTHRPLYLATIRLVQLESGSTLPEMLHNMRGILIDSGAYSLFSTKLVSVGYSGSFAAEYTRRFSCLELAYRLVTSETPRLTRASVPSAVIEASYTLDLDAYAVSGSSYASISNELGVNLNGID